VQRFRCDFLNSCNPLPPKDLAEQRTEGGYLELSLCQHDGDREGGWRDE